MGHDEGRWMVKAAVVEYDDEYKNEDALAQGPPFTATRRG